MSHVKIMNVMRLLAVMFRLLIAIAVGCATVANASTFMMHDKAMSSTVMQDDCTEHHHGTSTHMTMDMNDCVSAEKVKHVSVIPHQSGCLDCQTLHCQNISFISALAHDLQLTPPEVALDKIILIPYKSQIHSGYWTQIIRPPKN